MLSRLVQAVSTVGLACQVILGIIAFPFVLAAVKAHDATADTLAEVARASGL